MPAQRNPYIVLLTDPTGGTTCYGPFSTHRKAMAAFESLSHYVWEDEGDIQVEHCTPWPGAREARKAWG